MGKCGNKEMTTVYIEERQDRRLKELKAATGVSVAEWIRQGVDEILKANAHILQDDPISFIRASGDCICEECGDSYYHHPRDMKNLGYDNQPFLRVLCGGQRVKL